MSNETKLEFLFHSFKMKWENEIKSKGILFKPNSRKIFKTNVAGIKFREQNQNF